MAKHAKLFINNTNVTFLESDVRRESERGVDVLDCIVPQSVNPTMNHDVHYVSDMIDLTNVVAIYTFENHVKDESSPSGKNGTATNITYQVGTAGNAAKFNGTSSFISVADHADLNFSGSFDIIIKVRSQQTTKGVIYAKRTTALNGIAIYFDSGDRQGIISVDIAGTKIQTSTQINNDKWHTVRVYRDSSNVVTVKIDDVQEGSTPTISTNLTLATALLFGKDFDSTSFYNGFLDITRILKEGNLSEQESADIHTEPNAAYVMKFGGRIRSITDNIFTRTVSAKSYGKILGEQEIVGSLFSNQSPESIVQSLIGSDTDLVYIVPSSSSGVSIGKYIADGKLLDIITDLGNFIGWTFRTDALKNFIFEPYQINVLQLTFTHGTKCVIKAKGSDDSELVNDLTVVGANNRFMAEELFSGNGSTKIFNLAKSAVSARVTISSTEKTPDVDYTVDTENKQLQFTVAPVTGTNNIKIEYEYEDPIYVRGTKPSSIATYGRRAKKLILSWIKTQSDGIRFVQAYLIAFKDIRERAEIILPSLYNGVKENDVITVVNNAMSPALNTSMVVKSIQWKYPRGETILSVGEFTFDEFEIHKQVVDKIHDLENAVTTVKDLDEFQVIEETLALTDVITTIEYNQAKYADVAVYKSTYVYTRIEKIVAKYSSDNYEDEQKVYGS